MHRITHGIGALTPDVWARLHDAATKPATSPAPSPTAASGRLNSEPVSMSGSFIAKLVCAFPYHAPGEDEPEPNRYVYAWEAPYVTMPPGMRHSSRAEDPISGVDYYATTPRHATARVSLARCAYNLAEFYNTADVIAGLDLSSEASYAWPDFLRVIPSAPLAVYDSDEDWYTWTASLETYVQMHWTRLCKLPETSIYGDESEDGAWDDENDAFAPFLVYFDRQSHFSGFCD